MHMHVQWEEEKKKSKLSLVDSKCQERDKICYFEIKLISAKLATETLDGFCLKQGGTSQQHLLWFNWSK